MSPMTRTDMTTQTTQLFAVALTQDEVVIYRMVCVAAQAGLPCPVNLDFEDAVGFNSTSMGPKLLARLERKGLVVVQRSQKARRVMVVETGRWTAWPVWHKAGAIRVDRDRQGDDPLVAALVRLGVAAGLARKRSSGFRHLNSLSVDLEACVVLAGRRINDYLVSRPKTENGN
jgi:hypothetical protein